MKRQTNCPCHFKSFYSIHAKTLFIFIWLAVVAGSPVIAQHDSTYYETHNDVFHGRLYLIQKYNTLHYHNSDEDKKVNYFPHTIPGLGVGFTYDFITVNLSYGFRLYGNESEKGKTKYLDLQIHSYGKKFIVDVFGQNYKGLYVPGDKDADGNFYHRGDLKSQLIGGSFQYVMNNKRFSFRSTFLQSDWQKKSAGSLLLGFETYVGRISADSTLLQGGRDSAPGNDKAKEDRFWQVGPTIGYTYTAVIKEHFFVTGSLAESLNYGWRMLSEESNENVASRFVTNPSYRVVAGYNSNRWGVAIFYINNRVNIPGTLKGYELGISSGTFRINYVYKFRSKGKIGEVIDRI